MTPFALRGCVIWSSAPDALELRPDAFVVCDESGLCAGVFDALPPEYAALPVRDLGDALILPGYCDLHTHAAQYRHCGLGMDLTLIEWLDDLTYPEEARFADPDYAWEVYGRFAAELRAGFTTRGCIFASAHREGTEILMELLEKSGLRTMVGKVNMDRNAPDYLRERDAVFVREDTERWLADVSGRFDRTRPILTPRFVPSCTPEAMEVLADIRRRHGLPVQTHLDETPEEIAWVRELCPEAESYAGVYDRAGMLGPDAVMAHCLYLTDAEMDLLRRTGTFIAHCPASNMNVRSGIAPIRRYLDAGMNVGLGTDISGGHTLDMAQAVRDALSVSRLLWRVSPDHPAHLTAAEAFYLATAGGGAFFGRVGRFEPGYEFDAVAVDDGGWAFPGDSPEVRFQKMIYHAGSRNVIAKYAAGERLF